MGKPAENLPNLFVDAEWDPERADEHTVKNWKPKHDRVVLLRLSGYKTSSIASILDYSRNHVLRILRDPRAKKAMEQARKRMYSNFEQRIEEKMLTLGEKAVDNVAKTIRAKVEADDLDVKKHQDSVSFDLLDRIGFGKKQAGRDEGAGGIQLSDRAADRLASALEKSDRAREIHVDDVKEGEWEPAESTHDNNGDD